MKEINPTSYGNLQQSEDCFILPNRSKTTVNLHTYISDAIKAGTQPMFHNKKMGTFLPPDEYMSKRFDKSDIDLDINADFIETIKNKGELNKMDNLMNIKESAINIINQYRDKAVCTIGENLINSRSEILKSTKTHELIIKHRDVLHKELCELRCIDKDLELQLRALTIGSFGSFHDICNDCLTEDEKEKINKLENDENEKMKKISSKCSRLISSLDLCENREQVMDILKANDLVDDNGVIKDFSEINE